MKKYNIEINKITDYTAGYNINDAKKEFNLKKVIKLASNENPYGVPRELIRFLKKELKNIHLYPDQLYKDLINIIAYKINIPSSNIFAGNGSDEILDLFFKAFINPKDKIILFNPSFSLYKILAEIYGVKPVWIELGNFQYDIDKILPKIKKDVKAIIICNPNNPTGTYLKANSMERLIKKLNSNQFLCIDEAYFDFSTTRDFPDMLEIFKQAGDKKNIIICRTFSKIYSLAGLRIGYAFAKNEIIRFLNKIRIPFNINLLAERAAWYYLKNDIPIDKFKKLNFENKIYFYSELKKLKLLYIPSEANFILVKTHLPGKQVFHLLLQKGIIIRPFENPELKYYIRVTIGKKKEIRKLIKELKQILKIDGGIS